MDWEVRRRFENLPYRAPGWQNEGVGRMLIAIGALVSVFNLAIWMTIGFGWWKLIHIW